MIKTINQFKKYLKESSETEDFFNGYFELSDKDTLSLDLIKLMIKYHFESHANIDHLPNVMSIDPKILQLLREESIDYIKSNRFDRYLYRGIALDNSITIENGYQLKSVSGIEGWTTDSETANVFAEGSGKGQPIVLQMKLEELDILFAMDVFFSFISKEQYNKLTKDEKNILNNYVSEQEVLCKGKTYTLNENNYYTL